MKKKSIIVLCILMASIFMWAGCGLDIINEDSNEMVRTELEGTWIGNETGDASTTWTFVFSGAIVNVTEESEEEWYTGTFSLNTSSDPKQINLVILDCSYCESDHETCLGIYRIEEGVLTLIANEPGNTQRPTSFTLSGDSRGWTLTQQ
ncbi:MAG: TIGR03067 domain-containing protein [bacterium]